MRYHILPKDTLLDERYQIESLLGEGGFGITYAARNIRLDSKVAIKELFWRNHCARDVSASPKVELLRQEDDPVFQQQKERFLREARMIRDFSNRSDIARVLDYFEANDTAYIVMEYVEGETLGAYIAAHGPLDAEDAFRRFLPLVESLSFIHGSGVIHRDISPDNIMVQPDGSLKLIDFGAAREFTAMGGEMHSVIAKDSYAPPEQYDRNGDLGPWTDVYALCATMYTCITNQPPVSSMQRMFLDELRIPSELRPNIDGKYVAVVMRGLELSAAKRWRSMSELARAMQDVLPAPLSPPPPPLPLWKKVLICSGILVLCAAMVLGGILLRRSWEKPKFEGIVTETFCLLPPADMSAKSFAEAQEELCQILDGFAGADNYIVTVSGTELRVELPFELFGEREVGEVLDETLSEPLEKYEFECKHQIQVNWDDPTASMFAGENQILPNEFVGETAIFSYEISSAKLTAGQRANLLMDFKTRLDALDAPYAFGTVHGNPNEIVYRIDPSRIGRCVTETIGKTYPLEIAGETSTPHEALSFNSDGDDKTIRVIENDDGTYGLRYEINTAFYAKRIQEMTESLLKHGQNTLYLQYSDNRAFARLSFQEPIADGVLEFQDFMFDDMEKIDASHRYILDYLVALIGETMLPDDCDRQGEGIWDDKGDILFDEPVSEHFGLFTLFKDGNEKVYNVLLKLNEETGYPISYSNGMFWIQLHLQSDEHLIDNIASIVPMLLEKYPISDIIHSAPVIIQLMDEDTDRYRIMLSVFHNYETDEYYHSADSLFSYFNSQESPPYADEFRAWWETVPLEEYGYRKEV